MVTLKLIWSLFSLHLGLNASYMKGTRFLCWYFSDAISCHNWGTKYWLSCKDKYLSVQSDRSAELNFIVVLTQKHLVLVKNKQTKNKKQYMWMFLISIVQSDHIFWNNSKHYISYLWWKFVNEALINEASQKRVLDWYVSHLCVSMHSKADSPLLIQ